MASWKFVFWVSLVGFFITPFLFFIWFPLLFLAFLRISGTTVQLVDEEPQKGNDDV